MRDPAELIAFDQDPLFGVPPILIHAFNGFVDGGRRGPAISRTHFGQLQPYFDCEF